MTKSITPQFYKGVSDICGDTKNNSFRFDLETFSTVCIEAVYVIDFLKRGFQYVADHDLFLCGHSVEDAMSLGYDFYPKVIHDGDLPLLEDMHSAILQRLCRMKYDCGINYFSFTVRFKSKSGNLMVLHKIKPVFINGQIRFGICLMTSSAVPKAGYLRACYYNSKACDEYSPNDGEWRKKTIKPLSTREKTILRLAKQGKTGKEIAGEICISESALRTVETGIYQKLNVHTMIQAIVFATNHRLLFTSEYYHKNLKLGLEPEPKEKRRWPMMPETLQCIQQKLDAGQSVNSIAKQENVSECTIRYKIKTGKLRKTTV